MKRQLILTGAVLALAACGSKDNGKGTIATELQPGEWEMKTEVIKVEAEGLPAEVTNQMNDQPASIDKTCMTVEEAKKPKLDAFAGKGCETKSFIWSRGRIEGKVTCSGQNGAGETVSEMDGSYSGESIDLTIKSKSNLAGKAMTMEMRASGRRLGECPAESKDG